MRRLVPRRPKAGIPTSRQANYDHGTISVNEKKVLLVCDDRACGVGTLTLQRLAIYEDN